MRKKGRRMLAAALAAVLTVGTVSGDTTMALAKEVVSEGGSQVFEEPAQEEAKAASGDYVYTEREDGTLEISFYSGNDSVIAVPDQIDGKDVTSLGLSFSKGRPLYAVAIGANVSNISPVSFSDSVSLKYIAVDAKNPYYASKDGILYNKDMTELICCPIGREGKADIPAGVVSIGKLAFGNCHLLTEVTIPEGVASIGDSAFENCISLTGITIPASVTELGNAAFSGCGSMKEAELQAGNLTQIVSSAFSGCGLERIVIPEGIASIGDYAFQSCEDLREVMIPESVTMIGVNAFLDCKSLEGVTLSQNVAAIGGQAFQGCSSLAEIVVDGQNQGYAAEDGILYDKAMTELICCPAGKAGEAALSESVKKIGDYAFSGCAGLTGVVLPAGLEAIGGYAFQGCGSLQGIVIPEAVKEVGAYAFQDCSSLKSAEIKGGIKGIYSYAFSGCGNMQELVLPEGMETIGMYAFLGCSSLREIAIPASVNGIDDMTWEGCGNLASITVSSENSAYASDESGVLYNKNMTELICCPPNHPGGENGTFIVPEGVTSLKKHAFQGSRNLKRVELPESISAIGDGEDVFGNCSLLEEIAAAENNPDFASEQGVLYDKGKTRLLCWPGGKAAEDAVLPETVEGIGFAAFWGSNIRKITIPAHVKSIGPYAFADCGNLAEAVLSPGVEMIGEYAFYGCGSLTTVTLPTSLSFLGPEVFRGCANLAGIDVEVGNPQYVSEQGMLYSADKAQLIYTPEGKEGELSVSEQASRILASAFWGCGKLDRIQVPESVLYIENNAFGNCSPELVLLVSEASYAKDYAKYYKIKYEVIGTHDSHDDRELLAERVTCTAEGKKSVICAGCGRLTQEVVPPVGHKEVIDPAVPGTCMKLGKTEGSHCEVCGQILKEQRETKGSHQAVKEPASQPDCTNPGNTLGIYCSVCGTILTQGKEIPALGHDSKTTLVKATEKKDGKILVQCMRSFCKAIESETVIYAANDVKLSKTSDTYNGKTRKPSVTVKDRQGNKLKEKQDYTISYPSGMKNVGIYTVTIKLKGNYVGNIKKTYRIVPKGTSIVKLTSQKKGFTVKWKKQASQSTGYEISYSTSSKFTKKATDTIRIKKNKTTSKKVKKQKAKKKYYVRIRTWKTVKSGKSSQKVYSAWSKVKTVKTK